MHTPACYDATIPDDFIDAAIQRDAAMPPPPLLTPCVYAA